MKCAGSHATETCQQSRDTPAKCVLCGEAHPANYRGCIVYKSMQSQRKLNTSTTTQTLNSQAPDVNNTVVFPEMRVNQDLRIEKQQSTSAVDHPPLQQAPYSDKTKQQPRRQAPQISQSQVPTSRSHPQPPRQNIPTHNLPLKVKLPPEKQNPVHTPVQINPLLKASLQVDAAPPIQRRFPIPNNPLTETNNIPQASNLYPLTYQNPTDINTILSSFLSELKETIRPLITLLTRALSEIPFNVAR